MKCPTCAQENKDAAKLCKKCGRDMASPPAWFPDWRWHGRTLALIYACLLIVYAALSFAMRRLPKPYQTRRIPPEMTPWLKR